NAEHADVVVRCTMSGQTIQRAVKEAFDDVLVEVAGNYGEPQPFGMRVTSKRTRHCVGRLYVRGSRAADRDSLTHAPTPEACRGASVAAPRGIKGSVTVKVAPFPGPSLSAVISP